MAESKAVQFIMLEFPFIDSELYDEWDPRGMKLYWKMRRYVCRSNNHRLAGYWQKGYLATEGFQGTWAKMLGISQPTISKLLRWMEEKGIIICGHRSRTAGDPNVYILGKVFHVEGSDKPVEVFLMDHHYQAQSVGKVDFQSDTAELEPVLATDVPGIDVPLKMRKQTLTENETYSLENETYSPQNKTYSPGKTSNIEDRIVEDRIDTTTPEATPSIPGVEEPWKGSPPDAARVFRSRTNRWPPRTTYRRIYQAVGDDPADLEFWGEVVGEYVALGWNPTNVAGMLEWFERRELPKVQRKKGGLDGQARAIANLDAYRQRMNQTIDYQIVQGEVL